MKNEQGITTLFLDIGGVLLTNGWGHESRELAAEKFDLDFKEIESRHHLTFDTYELGKLTLDQYLSRTIFYKERSFTKDDFRDFMFAQSVELPGMIELMLRLKNRYSVKIAVVSNEGRELNEYRIKKFKLKELVDFFISSCFVNLRKPDIDIWRMAMDIAQVKPEEVLYVEDRPMFISVAEDAGLRFIRHVDYDTTCKELNAFGFVTT